MNLTFPSAIDFQLPWALLLLPIALIPFFNQKKDSVAIPTLMWLPQDRLGPLLRTVYAALATLCLASLIIAIAGPGKSQTFVERIGRGAELAILMDRSASMDAAVRRHELKPGEQPRPSESKNEVVRKALTWLVEQRPGNRYALTLFNVAPIPVAPFSDDENLILAGLSATGVGRGPNKTNMGRALVSVIEQFDDRSYTGSRAVLLVSDGGARLEERTQRLISEGLERNRISLYFIYIQSSENSPDLETVGPDEEDIVEEIALHQFFRQLGTQYRVFQANDPESMKKAVDQIDQQQNLPLRYEEQIPRSDFSFWFYAIAAGSIVILVALSPLRIPAL